ncbi:MAG TPA: hypothetical protein VK814_00045 [Acidobacteriaceae bacterium]|jgi:hypothetical protein|nr:hypothetical protein [Acidobacteriaceae bacterium]
MEMQEKLFTLASVDFGSETGDDGDLEQLSAYFVEQPTFSKFLEQQNRFLITTARKGVGKSALLRWIAKKAVENDPSALVIRVRGADLVRANFNLSAPLLTANDYVSDWMVRLCALVNRELAKELQLRFEDESVALVATTELSGFKSANLVHSLADRLQIIYEKDEPNVDAIQYERFERSRGNGSRQVWLIIDDLDATFQNTHGELLSLASFFSACRYFAQDFLGTSLRVSMRTDVWPLIRRFDEALDKVEQYVSEIIWPRAQFLKLLAVRVKVNLEHFGFSEEELNRKLMTSRGQETIVDKVFVPRMAWGEKNIETYKVIFTLSYERPRWAIQLCKLAQEAALREEGLLISKEAIDQVWGEYGYKRISDLVAEHKHQCPQVEELVNAFRGSERQMSTEILLKWIKNHVSNHLETFIEGSSTRSPKEIARFLFRIGFIVARSEDKDAGYEHYRFDQMPDLLSGNTNSDFNISWEIHPCYRQALDISKLNQSHRERFKRTRS